MNLLNKIREYILLLGILSLPIYQTINHWFFGSFIALSLIVIFSIKKIKYDVIIFVKYFIIGSVLFFVLKLISLFYTPDFSLGLKEFTRALPFVLYPIAIVSLKHQKGFNFKTFENKLFWALSLGCLLTALICWGNVIVNLEENPIPADKMFGWKKSGSYLTALLDLHPPYLGMIIFGCVVFMFKEILYNTKLNQLKKTIIYFLILFLLVFLFNLTARNSLFFLLTTAILFFVYKRKWKSLASIMFLSFIAIVVVINHPSQYYRLKMYHMLGLSGDDKFKDKRFERLNASYSVFKKSPLIGVGIGRDTEMKVEEYKKMKDYVAVEKRLNSHNQFFEYLVSNGIVGGLFFLIAIIGFYLFLYKHKYYFYLLLFLNIVFASITESIFERALGIQYYSLIVSLAILKFSSTITPNSKLNDTN